MQRSEFTGRAPGLTAISITPPASPQGEKGPDQPLALAPSAVEAGPCAELTAPMSDAERHSQMQKLYAELKVAREDELQAYLALGKQQRRIVDSARVPGVFTYFQFDQEINSHLPREEFVNSMKASGKRLMEHAASVENSRPYASCLLRCRAIEGQLLELASARAQAGKSMWTLES